MRALVTGGAGFIGSTLVDRLLAEGHAVDVIDDLSTGSLLNLSNARTGGQEFTFQKLDVRSPDLVELMGRRRPDVVYHLAGRPDVRASLAHPVLDAEVTILGSIQVLEAARRAGVSKVVYASSGGAIYGNPPPGALPVKESHPQQPLSPAGVAKKAVGDYLFAYRELHNLEFTALALANVYGPRQDPGAGAGVVATFAARLLAGERCTIFGDGHQTRDFVFVDDVVDAFARAAARGSGLLMNIGTGTETSVVELYRALEATAGVEQPVAYGPPRDGEPARSSLDPARAAIHLGWKPWTSLPDGLLATLEWARSRARPA